MSPFRYVGDRGRPKDIEIQSKTFVTVAIRTGQSVSLKDILTLRVVLTISRKQVDYFINCDINNTVYLSVGRRSREGQVHLDIDIDLSATSRNHVTDKFAS